MTLTTLSALAVSLLYHAVLFMVGSMLCDSQHLRRFLGFQRPGETPEDFSDTTHWVEKIGQLLKIIALVSATITLLTTIRVLG